jgi:hypothetical protein
MSGSMAQRLDEGASRTRIMNGANNLSYQRYETARVPLSSTLAFLQNLLPLLPHMSFASVHEVVK